MSDIEVDGCIIDSPKYVGLLLMRMLDAACDYRDGLHHFPGFFSAQAVVELFADLIDRPTCRNENSFDRSFFCSACGYEAWTHNDSDCDQKDFSFCPNCGAEVADDARI